MKIGVGLSSGVGSFGGGRWDGIGDLRDELHDLPNVTTFLNRIPHDRFRMAQRVHEQASALAIENTFDEIYLVWHSRGGEFELDVARDLKEMGVPVNGCYSADGWNRVGELVVPSNVLYLESWTQDRYWPRGVPIRLESDATEWVKHAPLTNVRHAAMASLPEMFAAVLRRGRGV